MTRYGTKLTAKTLYHGRTLTMSTRAFLVTLVHMAAAGLIRLPPTRQTWGAPSAAGQLGVLRARVPLMESTWDKLTSPKLFKTVTDWNGIHSAPLVPLRVLSGVLMVHHGSEGGFWPANVGTPGFDGFVDFIVKPYFSFLPGDPALWSAVHDYAEFWGGALLAVGLLTRPAALTLFVTMLGAVYFHLASTGWQGFPFGHVESYSYNFEEPTLYALIFLLFFFNGSGPLAVDAVIWECIRDDPK